ncbi:hypothetical protein SKAU_G00166110 [Synaphobranchus kaupii]|uniref:Uncharacterized protein n=1 Tax=Synaphobranchus kaupii TaxID=118154 RepID=A0A9Q1FJL2_SYNKA|nr:hypothetical protein SKAU_G00166110 [Synaphobranchus kaupii]
MAVLAGDGGNDQLCGLGSRRGTEERPETAGTSRCEDSELTARAPLGHSPAGQCTPFKMDGGLEKCLTLRASQWIQNMQFSEHRTLRVENLGVPFWAPSSQVKWSRLQETWDGAKARLFALARKV